MEDEPKYKGVGGSHANSQPMPFDEATRCHLEHLKASRENPANVEYERLRAELRKKGKRK